MGILGFLPTHKHAKNAKTNAKQVRPRCPRTVLRLVRIYLHTQTAVDARDIYMCIIKPWLV